jgi:uncharacterized protein
MGQFLRIAIVLFGLWLILRFIKRALTKRRSASSAPPPPADMLRCDYCGMFVPRSDAITASGKIYCGDNHADADRTKK